MSRPSILDTIVADKRLELRAAKAALPEAELRARIADLPPTRDFAAALRRPGEVSLIAEIKKASPSAGLIRSDFDPVAIAGAYAEAGAAAISVLTDAKYFQGSAEFLSQVREAVDLPLLRKDFVIDHYQLLEARAWGADAALLIVAILTRGDLEYLAAQATELGLTPLVEVHTLGDTEIAQVAGSHVIGINNRDLTVFETDLETTLRLRPHLPADRIVVSESGIRTPADVQLLREHNVDAVLIGEALMREPDIAAKTRSMVEAGRG